MTTDRWFPLAMLAFALGVGLAGCDALPPEPCPAMGMGMRGAGIDSLRVGERVELTAVPNLCMSPQAEVEWAVSNPGAVRLTTTGRYTVALLAVAPGTGMLSVWERGTPASGGYHTSYRVRAAELPALERERSAAFQTESLHYDFRAEASGWGGQIPVVFTNAGPDTVGIQNCSGATSIALQRQTGAGWVTLWRPAIPACVSPLIVVPPGSTYRSTVRVLVEYPGTPLGVQLNGEAFPGVYRLWWGAVQRGTGEAGPRLPEEQRVSNRFTIGVAAAAQ